MNAVPIQSALVLGSNGGFGQIFARRLIESGVREVHGIDLQPASQHPWLRGTYMQGSAADLGDQGRQILAGVDCVLACIPEAALIAAMPELNRTMTADRLLVDIASVKTPIATAYERYRCSFGHVGLHPMFAPIPDFRGRGMAMVVVRANERASTFEAMVRSWGVNPCVLSATEHDQVTANIQSLPHAALIAFGSALVRSGIPFETMWQLATPIHKTMLGLLYRVTGRDQSVHYAIQAENPGAASARQRFQAQVASLSAQVDAADEEGFCDELRQIFAWMAPADAQIHAIGEGVVGLTRAASSAEPQDPAVIGIE